MHLTESVRSCIGDIIKSTGTGMKSMILDDFTTAVIGAGYSRSEILLREVYLFEYIDTIFESSERLNHMKCIVILRPSKENVDLLCRELNRPHYRTYHIYFTCRVGSTLVKKLSESDETEVVRCIKELPLDFYAITPFLFSLKLENKTFDLKSDNWFPEGLKRTADGLASVMIALQVNPLIRYQTQSQQCKSLAEKVSQIIKNESLINKTWRKAAPFDVNSLLLIVDRRNDLITPLVNKWTYYAMIHEQLNIVNGRISLLNSPNRQPRDPKEMLVSLEKDQFFGANYFRNYGELGSTLKEAVEDLKSSTKSQHKVETMEDMKRFIDEYPETKKLASNLHNHVFLMSELTRIVTEHNIIKISECEQEMACSLASHSDILKSIKGFISSSVIRPIDAMRLFCLYAVCYPEKSNLSELAKLLKTRPDVPSSDIEFLKQFRKFILSKPQNPLDGAVQQVTRMIVQGVKGVDNTLIQHKPTLSRIIEEILKKGHKLRESDFAFYGERYKEEPPKRLIVFIVGGTTYDEALIIDQINRTRCGEIQVIIGGTTIHNFKTFMEEVRGAIIRKDDL